jgi:hypothetical protein
LFASFGVLHDEAADKNISERRRNASFILYFRPYGILFKNVPCNKFVHRYGAAAETEKMIRPTGGRDIGWKNEAGMGIVYIVQQNGFYRIHFL